MTDYPQEITPYEAELKFERLLIGGIGSLAGDQINRKPVPVVARVLSPSDVVIKIHDFDGRVRYSHRRWGVQKPSTIVNIASGRRWTRQSRTPSN